MADLILRNVDIEIVKALKERARRAGHSVETEHRLILTKALLSAPTKNSFADFLSSMSSNEDSNDFSREIDLPPDVPRRKFK